jgi:hypothetical protein
MANEVKSPNGVNLKVYPSDQTNMRTFETVPKRFKLIGIEC